MCNYFMKMIIKTSIPEQSTTIFSGSMANLTRLLGIIFRLWRLTAITKITTSEVQVPTAATKFNFCKQTWKNLILLTTHDLSGHVQSPAFRLNGLDDFLLELDIRNSRISPFFANVLTINKICECCMNLWLRLMKMTSQRILPQFGDGIYECSTF